MRKLRSTRRLFLAAGIVALMAGAWFANAQHTQASEVFRCGRGQSCVCVGTIWCTDQWEIGEACEDMWDCGA